MRHEYYFIYNSTLECGIKRDLGPVASEVAAIWESVDRMTEIDWEELYALENLLAGKNMGIDNGQEMMAKHLFISKLILRIDEARASGDELWVVGAKLVDHKFTPDFTNMDKLV